MLAALIAILGAAQAAPSNKKYSATVHVTNGTVTPTSATLTLTLTNKTRSQTLGSANITAPAGVTVGAVVRNADRSGWNAAKLGDSTVAFRSSSNALPNGMSVSADVTVTISHATCAAPPGNAAWTTQGKQSNDFSGSGNDFQFDPQGSDLVALGSFVIDDIETVTDDGQHVPAILTNEPKATTTTAYDICGEVKANYSGATRTATLLTGADFDPSTGLDWSDGDGVGDLSITPAVTETDNRLRVSDSTSGVAANSNFFDTTDRLCTSTDTEACEWSQGNKLKVKSDPPPEDASLGIGFNSSLSFLCGDATATVGGTPLVNINPRYELTEVGAIAVTLTYSKSATGNGPASGFDVCFRKDEATTWTVLGECPSKTPPSSAAPCFISRKRVTGGDLEVILWVATDDPWTGLG